MSRKPYEQLSRTAKYLYKKRFQDGECLDTSAETPRFDRAKRTKLTAPAENPDREPSTSADIAGTPGDTSTATRELHAELRHNLQTGRCVDGMNMSREQRLADGGDSGGDSSSSEDSDSSSDSDSLVDRNEDLGDTDTSESHSDGGEDAEEQGDGHGTDNNSDSGEVEDESEGEEGNEEDRWENEGNAGDQRPLYAGAPISVAESMLLILTLVLKHNLTGTCLADILTVIHLHCMQQNLHKISLYKFKKYFSLSRQPFTKHFYCSVCLGSLAAEEAMCPSCNARKKVTYFIEMNFLDQLKEMFLRDGFHDRLQHRFNRPDVFPGQSTVSDVYDGSVYKSLSENNGLLSDPRNISLTWYTDGVPVFKSSQVSMWPLYLTINELPYKDRIKRENTVLAGLWFGRKKASANTFVYSFRQQFERLHRGMNFRLPGGNVIKVRGVLLAGTCDLPAKAQFLNFMHFNAEFGCPDCYSKVQSTLTRAGTNVRVFKYENNPKLRTSAETVVHGNQALRVNASVFGVVGPCAFSKFMPDFIRGMGNDVMHSVYGGVVKKLLFLWFDSSCSQFPFSLRQMIGVIDEKLCAIKPPKSVHRLPRSVSEICHWKASELKMWFYFYAIPVLCGTMRPDFYEHFLLLVAGVSLLNGISITPDHIAKARQLLCKFVKDFETLYGLEFCSINIHQMLHLPMCVENLGPLWVYSCFPYEDLNGKLLNLIHGTSHIDSQVVSAHCYLIKMQRKLDNLQDGPIKDFTSSQKKQVKICERILLNCYSVGTYKKHDQMPPSLLRAMTDSHLPVTNVRTYYRLLKDGKLYVSEQYSRDLSTNSSYVVYRSNGWKLFGSVNCFIKISDECECNNRCLCNGQHYAVLVKVFDDGPFEVRAGNRRISLPHLSKCHRSLTLVCVPVNDLESVSVYMSVDNQSYIGTPVNSVELE